jgi:Protein of unknown function (DUF3606)
MADNLQNRGGQDRTRINLSQDHEVTYWSQRFRVSKEQLIAVVKTVGPQVEVVEQYLVNDKPLDQR